MDPESSSTSESMKDTKVSFIQRIYHPSDFSDASLVAFAHALKLSIQTSAHLHIHHVFNPHEKISWSDYPGVRQFLSKWGLIPEDSSKEDIKKLGLRVQKVLSENKDPVKTISSFIENHRPDLIVLATHQHHGVLGLMKQEMAIPIVRHTQCNTLFIPENSGGFVSTYDGSVRLQNILIPVDMSPSPHEAISNTIELVQDLALKGVKAKIVHVGNASSNPGIQLPQDNESISWTKLNIAGSPKNQILELSEQMGADLVVMTTSGKHGFLGAFKGSVTEHVIRHSKCAVLAVPE